MNDVWEVCSICFDAFEDPVMLPCGHKLCMKCAQSMSSIIIDKEDKLHGNNHFLSIDIAEYGITCPYRCSTTSRRELRRPSYDYLAMFSPDLCLRDFIICFLIDGSSKYMEMTLRAINSLILSTPVVFVGILVPPHYDTSDLYSRLVDPTRVIFKEFRTHFEKWNPTQYKLDIAQFSTEFKIVFWMDSDAYVYKDLTPLLMDFRASNAKFAFVADHVCTNPEFLGNWKNKNSPFIPQACFMGFRRDYIHSFFGLWEELWRKWIEPAPFRNFSDPVPSFAGSAFCIEQYALGMAIEKFGLTREDIFQLRRVCIPLGSSLLSQSDNNHHNNNKNKNNNNSTYINNQPSYYDGASSPSLLSQNTKKQKNGKRNNNNTLYYNNNNTNFGDGFDTYNMNFTESSYNNSNNTTSNNSYNDNNNDNFNTNGLMADLDKAFMEHISAASSFSQNNFKSEFNSSVNSSYMSSFSSALGAFWIDDIEGYILHFYSLNYEITFAWFTNHKNLLVSKTEEYWSPRRSTPWLTL